MTLLEALSGAASSNTPLGLVIIVVCSIIAFFAWAVYAVSSARPMSLEKSRAEAERSGPISPAGLAILGAYKYKASEYTPVDSAMNHWWTAAASVVPSWVAPNLVTLTGLSCLALAVLYGLYLSPDPSAPRPAHFYLFSAASFFAYQTLDAVDGKHARATASSSPLGQLFDHGCDALSVLFVSFLMAMALHLPPMGLFTVLMATQLPFFMAQWGERHTHVLRTSVGPIGVTEMQLFGMSMLSLAALAPTFFSSPLPAAPAHALASLLSPICARLPPFACPAAAQLSVTALAEALTPAHVVAVGYLAVAAYASLGGVVIATAHIMETTPSTASPGKAVRAALGELLPVVGLLGLAALWAATPWPEDSLLATPVLASAALGVYFTRLCCEMIVSAMTRDPFPAFAPSLLPLAAHVAALHVPREWCPALASSAGRAATLSLALAGAGVALGPWIAAVTGQISKYLGIYVLVLGRRPSEKKEKTA